MAAIAAASTNAADDNIVPMPLPITDAARRLQTRLWAVTYGLDVARNAAYPLDVAEWAATLFAEYGDLLVSRAPILEWPHLEPTRPETGVALLEPSGGRVRLPPLLWLLLLDDRRCATTEKKKLRRGPIMACLSRLVREHGLSLHDAYAYIACHDTDKKAWRKSTRALAFLMHSIMGQYQLAHAPLRALLTLGDDPNAPLRWDDTHYYGNANKAKHSPLYAALMIEDGLDAARLLLDYGARLHPALDAGFILCAMGDQPRFAECMRITELLAAHRTALSGLESAVATRGDMAYLGVFHRLVHDYAYFPRNDIARIDRMTTLIHGLHQRVGVSMLTLAQGECEYDDKHAAIETPKRTVLQYLCDLKNNTTAAEWERMFNTPADLTFFGGLVDFTQRHRLQRLINVIEPFDRAERVARRALAKTAELSLKRSRLFGGLTGELRRMVLRHVPAWVVQLPPAAAE